MRHPKMIAWDKKLRNLFDSIDDFLEDRYGGRFPLHPSRAPRGTTSSKSQDGLFTVGASFTAGYGSELGRGYSVKIHMSTLASVPPQVKEEIRRVVLEELRSRIPETFEGRALSVDMDGNLIKIHGDLSLGSL